MDIKDQITEWQGAYIDRCCTREEEAEANANLELVLFAIDTLVNKVAEPSVAPTFQGGGDGNFDGCASGFTSGCGGTGCKGVGDE